MASTYGTVRYKDEGDSVKALQTALNSAGCNLDVDGIFGKNTLNAVKSYQKANGLTVDGIVGNNTWGALNRASQEAPSGSQTGSTPHDEQTTTPGSGTATEPATGTGSGLSEALEQLIAQYNATQAYTPKTSDEIRVQAEGEYQSYYDQLRLASQQQHQQNDMALQQQREGLSATYDKQREDSRRQYAQAYSQADRQMLSRGMQRSSYGAQTLANISAQGAEAQQDISDARAAAEGNIDERRAQIAQQLADQMRQFDAGEAADVLNRIRELEDQEYERGQASDQYRTSLSAQLYQMMYQAERDKVADQQWQAQFDESVRQYEDSKKKSSGRSTSRKPKEDDNRATEDSTSAWDQFFGMMNAAQTLGGLLTGAGGGGQSMLGKKK